MLLSGKRVELDAVPVNGVLALGSARRPFEMILLDHPTYPLSLRVAYGPRDGGIPFKPDFAREIVRIDYPAPQNTIAEALTNGCRVELQGIYFDFNEATLKLESVRALEEIASALKSVSGPRLRLEGQTDDIGSERYNDDLSTRRAEAVKTALAHNHGVDAGRLSTVDMANGGRSRRTTRWRAARATAASNCFDSLSIFRHSRACVSPAGRPHEGLSL